MRLVDANVLLYAVNSSSRQHVVAREWLEDALNGREPVAFSWVVLLAFIRISTRKTIFPQPLEVDEACGYVEAWLAQNGSIVVQPTHRHLAILTGLVRDVGTGGNLTSDAHLAALAVEHGATIWSFDRDFARFPGVDIEVPSS